MLNDQVFNLVVELLKSDLTQKTKDDTVRFLLLPRNTPVRPMIELPDDELKEELGTIKRPDHNQIRRKNNPKLAEEQDAMKETLEGRI